jgi:hypothetical protein
MRKGGERVQAAYASFIFGGIAVITAVLLLSCCGYEKEPSEWEMFSWGYESPEGSRLLYARKYELYRKPTGLNRFPDGGQPKYLRREMDLYLYDRRDESLHRIGEIAGRSGYPPNLHVSWRGDRAVYWLRSVYNRTHVPPVDWAENVGIYLVNTRGLEHRRILEYGEMPALSPDGSRIAFLERIQDDNVRLRIARVDGEEDRAVRSIEEFDVNWIEWSEEELIYLYSSVSDKKVYLLEVGSGELRETDREYHANPPHVERGEISELVSPLHAAATPAAEGAAAADGAAAQDSKSK